MKKLTKSQVIALVKKNGSLVVELYPSNCSPYNQTWVRGYEIQLFITPNNEVIAINHDQHEIDTKFNDVINSFSYYNCNNELGKRVHYYTKETGKN